MGNRDIGTADGCRETRECLEARELGQEDGCGCTPRKGPGPDEVAAESGAEHSN
jgi:hypothetical protein